MFRKIVSLIDVKRHFLQLYDYIWGFDPKRMITSINVDMSTCPLTLIPKQGWLQGFVRQHTNYSHYSQQYFGANLQAENSFCVWMKGRAPHILMLGIVSHFSVLLNSTCVGLDVFTLFTQHGDRSHQQKSPLK